MSIKKAAWMTSIVDTLNNAEYKARQVKGKSFTWVSSFKEEEKPATPARKGKKVAWSSSMPAAATPAPKPAPKRNRWAECN